MRVVILLFIVGLFLPLDARAETARIAVAANFAGAIERLETAFEASQDHQIEVSLGSTGQLYAQIVNGAPFEVFLSADQARPEALARDGLAVAPSRFTYAEGRLFLRVARASHLAPDGQPAFDRIKRIAIANPRTAPYGAAAEQVLAALGVVGPQIAQAQSVQGVAAVVELGAADAGFVAYSSVAPLIPVLPAGWLVPTDLHDPLRQDAVLLSRGQDNPAALAFLDWLAGPAAQRILQGFGYHVD